MDNGQKIKILAVDDHPENLLTLEAILDDPAYELVRAASGEQALRLVLDQEFAVILLDAKMPGMDGFETAIHIRKLERCKNMPIIFITAFSKDEQDIRKGYVLGAVDYVFKPVAPEILRAKVKVFADLFDKTQRLEQKSQQLKNERDQLNQELQYFERMSGSDTSQISKQMFSVKTLRLGIPDEFERLTQDYAKSLILSVESQKFKTGESASEGLRSLAETLGFLGAGPRDVVELHTQVIKSLSQEAPSAKARVYLQEGRLMLIELMGLLVAYYRTRAVYQFSTSRKDNMPV